MNMLEQEMLDRSAKRMADEIDREIIENITMEILIEDGWTQTNLNPPLSEYGMMKKPFEDWYYKTAEWIGTYAQGASRLVKGQWLFNDPRDATMFILRWS